MCVHPPVWSVYSFPLLLCESWQENFARLFLSNVYGRFRETLRNTVRKTVAVRKESFKRYKNGQNRLS
jgi:hypothetical protein